MPSSRRADENAPPRDHHAEVTRQIIAALEAGTPPWRQPWENGKSGEAAMPRNAITDHPYRGVNTITLGMSPSALASGDPRWATYKQAAGRGWQVRKGARGTTGYFYKRVPRPNADIGLDGDTQGTRSFPLLRAFTLFHASQIDGIGPYVAPSIEEAPWRTPEATQTIVENSRAVVRIGGDKAFYSPGTDHIQIPARVAFGTASAWSSTILHELGHWSGTKDRLDRDLTSRFGSEGYAREEIRVELAQSMVCAALGLADRDFTDGAAYIASWIKILRDDKKEIFRAASDAQRIADYLLGFHPAYANRDSAAAIPSDNDAASDHAERLGIAA